MKKKIFAIISLVVMAAMVFTACSAGKGEEANGTTDASEAVSVSVSEESTTEAASAESTTEATTAAAETTTVTTTKKAESTSKKPAAQTTTKKQQTEPKQTTTKAAPKQTTTQKPQTTVKNISAKDVQAQVNSYIKSKGVNLDSSLTPKNAGWYPPVSAYQSELNSGWALKDCKGWVDELINQLGTDNLYLYCYYDGVSGSDSHTFYILYM